MAREHTTPDAPVLAGSDHPTIRYANALDALMTLMIDAHRNQTHDHDALTKWIEIAIEARYPGSCPPSEAN